MPCCGLTEYRERVPFRYTAAGTVVFWGAFALAVIAGALGCWRPGGRRLLAACGAFLAALWRDTMRNPSSVPARWACRMSGRLLPISPAAAEWVFRHPEAPVLGLVVLTLGILAGVIWLCSSWA